MAQNKGFGIDFNGFLDLAEQIDEKFNTQELIWAAEVALERTKDYVNGEIAKIVYVGGASKDWTFDKGVNYSQGKAQESFSKVSNMSVEVVGTEVTAYAGFDLADAPEVLLIIYGTPHTSADKKLYNAVKVKGRVKKEVERIQKDAFTKALSGILAVEEWRKMRQ